MSLDDRPALREDIERQVEGLSPPTPPVPIESVEIPSTRLTEEDLAALGKSVGADGVDVGDAERIVHSVGKSYRDMVAARSGRLTHVTDAVVFPQNEDQVVSLLNVAEERGLSVVPFGGGTSVVGGVEPRLGEHRAVITLDLMHLRDVRLDRASHLAEIGAGAFGPDIERALGAQGFTLGHFPQSFEFSTFGGWVATRSAGQQSTHYGKIEDMVEAVRLATSKGMVATRLTPASAVGPSVLQQLIGSEGVFGVITSGTAHVKPLPETTRFQAYFLPDWPASLAFLRDLLQAEIRPGVVRLSDAEETRWLLKTSSSQGGIVQRIGKAYVRHSIRRRGFDPERVCLCLLGAEGSAKQVRVDCDAMNRAASKHRAVALGSSPGRSWKRDRFSLPYLRDDLMARGVMVDTLETATTWANLEKLYNGVRAAIEDGLRSSGTPGAVMTHVSHVYATGASLYYTFLAKQIPGQEVERWQAIKTAATDAIVHAGGTLSHHHGIGYEHLPLEREHGPIAVEALRSLKGRLDPRGVMNPEKLL